MFLLHLQNSKDLKNSVSNFLGDSLKLRPSEFLITGCIQAMSVHLTKISTLTESG